MEHRAKTGVLPEHLLNVRACDMSAFPDDPEHFVRWLGPDTPGDRHSFMPLQLYERYIRDQLETTAELSVPRYIADPWSPMATDGLSDDDTVLLLGTGLTAVDVTLSLDRAGFRGLVVALSRRGLQPRSHALAASTKISERPDDAPRGVGDRGRSRHSPPDFGTRRASFARCLRGRQLNPKSRARR